MKPDYSNVQLTIQQASIILDISKPTLRYWEKEFGSYLSPNRTSADRRYYTSEDLGKALKIKRLLKVDGHTIKGVKKKLRLKA